MLATAAVQDNLTIEDFMAHPCDRMEWVDSQLMEKDVAIIFMIGINAKKISLALLTQSINP